MSYIVLLDNFLEASVIESSKLSQVVYISDDIVYVILEQLEVFLGILIKFFLRKIPIGRRPALAILPYTTDDIPYFPFRRSYPSDNFLCLDTLKSEDFVEFTLEFAHESLLIILVPWFSFWMGIVRAWLGLVRSLEAVLEIVVGDIIVVIVLYERCPELLTKAMRQAISLWKVAKVGRGSEITALFRGVCSTAH